MGDPAERLRQEYDISIDRISGQELTRHGTEAFPVMVYRTVLRENVLGYVNWHWHRELQLCIVTRGEVDFYVGDRRHRLREGTESLSAAAVCIWRGRQEIRTALIIVWMRIPGCWPASPGR